MLGLSGSFRFSSVRLHLVAPIALKVSSFLDAEASGAAVLACPLDLIMMCRNGFRDHLNANFARSRETKEEGGDKKDEGRNRGSQC